MVLFLALNGLTFRPANQAEAVITMLRMAAGDIADEDFTHWVRANAVLNAGEAGAGEGNRTLLASLEG